jgi:RimJ/RimL family protein N-acetyltransferase
MTQPPSAPHSPGRTSPFILRRSQPDLPIRTDRLLLRRLTELDVDGLHAFRGDPETCTFLPFDPQTPDFIRQRLAGVMGSTDLAGEHAAIVLGVERAGDGRLIGDLVLFHYAPEHGSAEIGWVFHRDVAGQGYATEAVTALIAMAFDELGLRRLTARIDELNGPSVRLADRLGMRQEARLIENEWFKDHWSTELDYAILDREWLAR